MLGLCVSDKTTKTPIKNVPTGTRSDSSKLILLK